MLVREITGKSYIDYPLDHVMPEGVKELGEAVNQFILWNRCEIVLDGPASLQNQLMSLLSQMVTLLVFLSHRKICNHTDTNCNLHLGVFQGIKSTGK
jgi:hypothetical protein